MKRLFHYTTASRLQNILKDKLIRPATAFVERSEKPAVWCTFRQDWEPTATPMLEERATGKYRAISFEELAGIDTPARIEIAPSMASMDWPTWRRLSGVGPKEALALAAIARKQKSYVADWRMSFEPITIQSWRAIEFFIKGQWRDFEEVMPAHTDKPATEGNL